MPAATKPSTSVFATASGWKRPSRKTPGCGCLWPPQRVGTIVPTLSPTPAERETRLPTWLVSVRARPTNATRFPRSGKFSGTGRDPRRGGPAGRHRFRPGSASSQIPSYLRQIPNGVRATVPRGVCCLETRLGITVSPAARRGGCETPPSPLPSPPDRWRLPASCGEAGNPWPDHAPQHIGSGPPGWAKGTGVGSPRGARRVASRASQGVLSGARTPCFARRGPWSRPGRAPSPQRPPRGSGRVRRGANPPRCRRPAGSGA